VWCHDGVSSGPSDEIIAAATGELKEILQPSHNYGGQYDAMQQQSKL
jgi:hypothetical protein